MARFKALTLGTLSNPYRMVSEGEIVELTEAEAKHYEKSKWLRPLAEVNAMKAQPLMPHMRIVGGVNVSGSGQLPEYARSAESDPQAAADTALIGTENFGKQMEAIKAHEANLDGRPAKAEKNKGKGTGNQDPLA